MSVRASSRQARGKLAASSAQARGKLGMRDGPLSLTLLARRCRRLLLAHERQLLGRQTRLHLVKSKGEAKGEGEGEGEGSGRQRGRRRRRILTLRSSRSVSSSAATCAKPNAEAAALTAADGERDGGANTAEPAEASGGTLDAVCMVRAPAEVAGSGVEVASIPPPVPGVAARYRTG